MRSIILFMLTSMLALADCTQLDPSCPKYMIDSVITVTLKNGKTYTFSGNEWAVVRRRAKPLTPAPIVARTKEERETSISEASHKNRVRVMGGIGPTGIEVEREPNLARVRTHFGFVGGLGYDRSIFNKWSLGIAGYTNGTASLGVGYDF